VCERSGGCALVAGSVRCSWTAVCGAGGAGAVFMPWRLMTTGHNGDLMGRDACDLRVITDNMTLR